MCFHLKIYVILFNSFCVFLLEHIDIFWMLLLLLATENNTIMQNEKEDRESVTSSSWVRLANPWKLFKQTYKTAQFLGIQYFEMVYYYWLYTSKYTSWSCISLALFFKKDAYQVCLYIVILKDAQSFPLGTVLLFYHYCTHQSNLVGRSLQ